MDFGEDDYVDPSESRGQSRPGYAKSRKTVGAKQNMRRTGSGNWEYDSAVTPGVVHKLNSKGQEEIKKRKGDQSIFQQPALDHIVQYAALNEHYHSVVKAEREKASNGHKRRNSLDLHNAFASAVADSDNLRLVSHGEHVSFGGSKHTGQFSDAERRDAKALFEKHMPATESTPQQQAVFNAGRPKSSVPLPSGTAPPPSGVTLRPRKKAKF